MEPSNTQVFVINGSAGFTQPINGETASTGVRRRIKVGNTRSRHDQEISRRVFRHILNTTNRAWKTKTKIWVGGIFFVPPSSINYRLVKFHLCLRFASRSANENKSFSKNNFKTKRNSFHEKNHAEPGSEESLTNLREQLAFNKRIVSTYAVAVDDNAIAHKCHAKILIVSRDSEVYWS